MNTTHSKFNRGKTTLPEPDAVAHAHSEKVAAHVRRLLDAGGGWLSLHDYMQAVLYAPGLGYYMAGTQKFGEGGDFITASELTPLYAQTWAMPISAALVQAQSFSPSPPTPLPQVERGASNPRPPSTDSPFPPSNPPSALPTPLQTPVGFADTPFEKGARRGQAEAKCSTPSMLELGGGSGLFAAHLLQQLKAMNCLPDRYAILELSPTLRERQRQTLHDKVPDLVSRVEWLERLPDTFHGVVFMNEVLDAIPPRVVERVGDAWYEHGVRLDDGRFIIASQPLSDPALQALAASRFPVRGDYVAELNIAGEALLETLGQRLTSGSTLFIIDYGFERAETLPAQYAGGTLRAYYRHHVLNDPLLWPGLLDITCHVDFVAMAEAAQRGGLALTSFQTQGEFLQKQGILDHLTRIGAPEEAAYLSAAQAVRTLINPEAMGGVFKVVVFRN
ncbi:MAG: SAM-dependent methyltransferase [Burkholderiales bacterium]|jgi:SAM-dependent MidA family methyltransferase|nr:SAM-dependent methyltransferase [Burkholderiales bacterium]